MKLLNFLLVTAFVSCASADDWPRWFGPEADGVWREDGILAEFPSDGPKVLWRSPIGPGYCGPAVVGDRVYVLDRQSQDRRSGNDRVLCLDAKTGELVWNHDYASVYEASYPAGPRATPTIDEDRVYTLGTEGQLFCFKRDSGEVIWSKEYKRDFGARSPTWGFAAAPLVDGELLITLPGSVIALNKKTGEEVWRALPPQEPGYCAPRIIEYGDNRQLLIWRPDGVYAFDVKSGKVVWEIPWKLRAGLSIPTPRVSGDGKQLFLTAFYNGSLMLGLKADGSKPDIQWRTTEPSEKRTTHLNSIMSTPVLADGHIYGVCSYGQFRCLKMDSGERVWEDLQIATGGKELRWGNVFITPHEPSGRYFLFNELGDLLVGKLTPSGFEEQTRAHLLEPNGIDLRQRPIVWSHPAYADLKCFVRNDTEIICVDLAE